MFLYKGINILKEGGFFSFILPMGVAYQDRSSDAREYIFKSSSLRNVVLLGDGVFGSEVTCPSAIITISSRSNMMNHYNLTDLSLFPLNNKRLKILSREGFDNPQSYSSIERNKTFSFTISDNVDAELNTFKKLVELVKFKDAGINYQRKKIGLEQKGGGDLALRLFYEGSKKSVEDIMYWKGEGIYSPKFRKIQRFLCPPL